MHTLTYLSQPYEQNLSEENLTVQEIVENQEKHIMLIPRSAEDREYIKKLESKIVKDIPDEVVLKKCEEYFTRGYLVGLDGIKIDEDEISEVFERKYCVRKTNEKIDLKKEFDLLFNSENYVMPKPEIEPHSLDQKLNLLCHCHNCGSHFPLKNIKWIDSEKDTDEDSESKYSGIEPMCVNYPTCPSSWSCFDLWLKSEQYSLEDHKNGKYD